MPRPLLSILLFVTFIFGTALNSFAWDDLGHKITAYIAWQQMTPAARENVIRILRLRRTIPTLQPFISLMGRSRRPSVTENISN